MSTRASSSRPTADSLRSGKNVIENDRDVLDRLVDEFREALDPGLNRDLAFHLFATRTIVHDVHWTDALLMNTCTDGGGDGQLDSAFLSVGGKIVRETSEVPNHKGIELTVHLVQSTTHRGFSKNKLAEMRATANDIFVRDAEMSAAQYNAGIRAFRDLYWSTIDRLDKNRPDVKLMVYFASFGDSARIHQNVRDEQGRQRKEATRIFGETGSDVGLYGARELVELADRGPSFSLTLHCAPSYVIDDEPTGGCCALIRLSDFVGAVSDGDHLKEDLVDENVRSWLGDPKPNKAIRESLDQADSPFWWKNNGVTFLCESVECRHSRIYMTRPKIVNGLQTSSEVMARFAKGHTPKALMDSRIVVRVIKSEDAGVRDEVIRATNTQSKVAADDLRATSPIHRKIEVFLRASGIFYERRKGQYPKGTKRFRPRLKKTALAQAILALGFARADEARARPGDFFSSDTAHQQLFDERFPLVVYRNAALVQMEVDRILRSEMRRPSDEVTNWRFHVSMASWALSQKIDPVLGLRALAADQIDLPSSAVVRRAFSMVEKIAAIEAEAQDAKPDRVSKSSSFNRAVILEVRRRIGKSARQSRRRKSTNA